MAVIRSYNQPTVEARPAPAATVPANAPVGAFGNAMQAQGDAQAQQTASAYLDRAANTTEKLALSMMDDANEARVQEIANGFMSGTQFSLYTDKDAFYRKRGQDAINGAQAATDKLLELKKEAVGLAANDTQRKRLDKMLGAQIMEANGGISRHVAQQAVEWEKGVTDGKLQLLRNQAALDFNDIDKLDKLAIGAEETARQKAKLAGLTGTEGETAMIASARSDVYTTAIQQRIQNDQKRSALALYDKVASKLDEKDNLKLASAIKSVRTEVEAEDWISRSAPNNLPPGVKQYAPQIHKASAEYGVDPALATAVMAQESQGNKGAVSKAGARGLMQLMPGTASDLGVKDPHDPDQNIPGGVKYLSQQLAKYNGDQRLALMAYNWGPGNVDKWLKAGSNPANIPEETRNYIQRVQGFVTAQGVGFDKANTGGLVLAAMNDPSLSAAVKASVATKLTKESTALEATRTAQIKGLRDTGEAALQMIVMSPMSVKKGTFGAIADGFEAAGEKSDAVTYRFLASIEDQLATFSQAPKSAQEETLRTVAAALAPGKAGSLMSALNSANNKDKADSAKTANADFDALKMAGANRVRMETLVDRAKGVVDGYARAGDFTKAREAQDWFNAQVNAQAAGQAPAPQLAAAIADMRTRIESGEQTNMAIRQLDAMKDAQQRQETAFAKDALTAGSEVYGGQIGPLPPVTDLPARVAYASKVSEFRGGEPVLPFTEPEIATMRQKLDESPPAQQAKTFQGIAANVPADMIPQVAAALSGKDGGDRLSRSYAAALSFYAEKDPASQQVAAKILRGAELIRNGGDGVRKPAMTEDAWQSALQERIGNLFRDADPRAVGIIPAAVASYYVAEMHRSGRQGEKTDIDVLNRSIVAVLGEPVVRNGQAFLPPSRGMGAYDVDKAMRVLSDGDLDGVKTLNGDPLTAEAVRAGILTNGKNGEGWYFVRIKDPTAGMELRPVLDRNGNELQIDLRPLIERARMFPESAWTPTPDASRRRAPTSPTEGVKP